MDIRIHLRSSVARAGALALAATFLLPGCAYFTGRPDTLAPPAKLYEDGERELLRARYEAARDLLRKIVERHPDSDLVPRAQLMLGETYYREQDYERAIREFEAFMTRYPGHPIADLVQHRLARSYFDQMPSVERDQAITTKALAEFQKLIKQYPESRYAPDAIVKIEACRLRLAEKELWIADYYVRRGNFPAALQRYEAVLKEYGRTALVPRALFEKAEVLIQLGRTDEAASTLQRLVEEYPASEWSRRARERQTKLL